MCGCEKMSRAFFAMLYCSAILGSLSLIYELAHNKRPKLRLECVVATGVTPAHAGSLDKDALANKDADSIIQRIQCNSVGALPKEFP